MSDILEQLDDLIKQATTERSHYYVASVAKTAKREIESLRALEATAWEFLKALAPKGE